MNDEKEDIEEFNKITYQISKNTGFLAGYNVRVLKGCRLLETNCFTIFGARRAVKRLGREFDRESCVIEEGDCV